ncbi:MAG: heme o synthase [Firmicutes bacterium]|nr:heme o synthase [Bacillota bacterium]
MSQPIELAIAPTKLESSQLTDKLSAYLALTKPRIIELLLITTVPTMFVASKHLPSALIILLTVLGGALAAGGANAFNMVYDMDIDKVMKRTSKRPLVTGQISPKAAIVFASSLEVSSFFLLWQTVNLLSAVLAVSATGFYVFVYTMWLKRSTSQNIVIGGAAGAVPVLVGWTAITGHLSWTAVVLFLVIFLWTPPHFWALALKYKDDYKAANIPMLPAVVNVKKVVFNIQIYTVILMLVSLAIAPVGHLGPVFFVISLLLGITFCYKTFTLNKDVSEKNAMKLFGYSITYLTLLFLSMGLTAIALHP